MTPSAEDRNYIAAFMEAEGCAYVRKYRGRVYGRISITQRRDPTALQWMQEVMGMGVVYTSDGLTYRFRVNNQEDVRQFIKVVWPYIKMPTKRIRLRLAYRASLGHRKYRRK